VNVAPMGPWVPDTAMTDWQAFVLRPYKTSQTYRNLREHPEGVFHITDDVLLLAQAAIGPVTAQTAPALAVVGRRLADCCRFYEFRIDCFDDAEERTKLMARVVRQERIRDFVGFHRARHAVVEAAIAASRVGIIPTSQILADLQRLRPLVDKTAGPNERQAFELLVQFVQSRQAHGICEPAGRNTNS
jgi:hypothetical protein